MPGRRTRQPPKPAEKVLILVAGIGLVGTITAAFIANIDKWRPNQNNNSANANATPQVVGSPTPSASGGLFAKIEQVEVVPQGDKASQVFLFLSIENTGAPAAVPGYDILINHVTSKSFEYSDTLERELKDDYSVPQAGGKAALTIHPEDSLTSKTRVAIGNGGKATGWLRLALPVSDKTLKQPGTRYTVSFTDTMNNAHQAVYEMK